MVERETFRYGFFAAVVTGILALTGIFGNFAEREVIGKTVDLSTVFLVIVLAGTGYFVARRVSDLPARIANGLVGSLVVGGVLAILVFIEAHINLSFVFVALGRNPMGEVLTFGQDLVPGLLILLGISAGIGALAGLFMEVPGRVQMVVIIGFAIVVTVGILINQINSLVSLPDSLTVILAAALAYAAAYYFGGEATTMRRRMVSGLAVGLVVGSVLAMLINAGGLDDGGFLRGTGNVPRVLGLALDNTLFFILVFGILGMVSASFTISSRGMHNGAIYVMTGFLVLGLMNGLRNPSLIVIIAIFVAVAVMTWLTTVFGERANQKYEALNLNQQHGSQRLSSLIGLAAMLIVPIFAGQYITSVLDWVIMYTIMGIGLNVMIGYAGLLDLGYVALFAIGAYSVGLFTTPSLVTCGGVSPADISPDQIDQVCTGVMTFWQAWPLCFIISGMAGVLLGIPVLRLRGDYLAIVTLGFGEIIRLLVLSNDLKPLLGAAQGIAPIPSPEINLGFLGVDLDVTLGNATSIYYLFLASALVAAFVVARLASTRLGRAWRAMRADEDVAEAMGIHLVRTKLLAFAVSSAFAGLGGAIFGVWLKGVFPNSFVLLVSVNVVSLIIIGGLGSIPGAVLGSFILIGLPEVLRELQDYRLLAFGALLVVAMLLRPEGLLPPPIRRLSENFTARQANKEVQS
jgi:ABC-type branched-subunit amino acid transport system permease subunit